jgi:two-component system, chemotaxis family, protein-glutamate methylesterase/glutaminase
MPKKRILIVDDSVVIRRSLANALARDSDLEVVGSASNGRIALMKIPLLHPDMVALDVEMPDMGGMEALAEIRKLYPQLPVIMLSEPTDRGVAATLDALTLGAKDYVTKPDIAMNAEDVIQILSDELAAKIFLHCPCAIHQQTPPNSQVRPLTDGTSLRTAVNRAVSRVDVLAVAVSTGGPNALMDLIPRFPADFPVPILIVQHMPPTFTKLLAERLAAKCKIRVAEGSLHQAILPGGAWIAPGNFHMVVEMDRGSVRIRINEDPPENFCRPSADVLFRSVAQVYGARVLAVVMTGMGRDGLRGCETIHAAGGQIVVQDEASSVVWGMPGLIVKAGIADQILPLHALGAEIMDRVWKHRPENCAHVGDSQMRPATRD